MTRQELREAITNVAILYAQASNEADRRESLARVDKDGAAAAGTYRNDAERFRQELKGFVRDYLGMKQDTTIVLNVHGEVVGLEVA